APVTAYKFIHFEINEGSTWSVAFKRLIINSHILPYKLDWLHFGYAVTGIQRELVGKAIKAKVAVSFRGHDIIEYPQKHPGCYDRLWKNINKVHTISDDLLRQAYLLGLSNETKVIKITPAISCEIFNYKRQNFFNWNVIKIVTVARLNWAKGLGYILDALAQLKNTGINFHYKIIGDGPEMEYLSFSVYQLGLLKNVELIGKLEHSQIPFILQENDIYIQYSIREGFCNAVLEAQSAGLLCIVSDAEGLSENVIDNKTGWVVPKRRPDLLANKIIEVINMPMEQLLSISHAASERVRNEFNLEKQKRDFVNFYND
ncbi:MAG: glycosyltransferase family 4 protein, partial [Spirochaetes bacterium]|nr:glycosyltransferase family 4 protein [Spirochaetota bacterium]